MYIYSFYVDMYEYRKTYMNMFICMHAYIPESVYLGMYVGRNT